MRRWLVASVGVCSFWSCLWTSLWSSPASAQFFSPGPLARVHAGLEGLEKCSKCHEERKGLSARLCLDCHTELQTRVAKGTGFHGRLPAAKKQECQSCHPDHRGVDLRMIDWEGGRDAFDHRKAGWPLRGAHAKVRCDDCHQKRLIVDGALRRLLERQPTRATLLGLSTRCDGCHFDEHRGQLARECQKCHVETTWKPAPAFDHQASGYPLRGKHKQVACAKCHATITDDDFLATAFPKPRAATFMEMNPVEHDTCESCHNDPHKGTLGTNCAGCHSEAGWKLINTGANQDTTFHDKTKFPLRGGHIGVACKGCHGPFPGQPARFKGLAFAACSDCHEDGHLGELRTKAPAKVAPCEGCHTVNAFVPARYELEQHQTTRFPLDGAHAAVACRGCHPVDEGLATRIPMAVRQRLKAHNRRELFSFAVLRPRKAPQACNGCHEDVHRGQFAVADASGQVVGKVAGKTGDKTGDKTGGKAGDASGGTLDNCAQCHKTTSFADVTFNHDTDSRFRLTGKHRETPCGGCHRPTRIGSGPRFVRYKPLDLTCAGCHADYHQGQFLASAPPAPAKGHADQSEGGGHAGGHGCEFCHKTNTFKDSLFEHNNPDFSPYPLEGKHVQVACRQCHPTVRVNLEVETVRYRPLPRGCEDCHVDFHRGGFQGFEP